MSHPVDYMAYGPLYAGWARGLSLLSALALAAMAFAAPQLIAASSAELKHGLLTLCLWGVSAGFVHGVGYVPRLTIWRWTLGPYVGWPVMALCVYLWVM
ncbi:cyd operon YbgE family protein [Hahella sp. KA22]|uniref:cyd operon YbgE family protein n=1 Tax=unclassified Hahella TaxID=2624107 RepID=UPI0019D474F0|nr:cyd operon YbgE family protein [Hahella sp. KA22]